MIGELRKRIAEAIDDAVVAVTGERLDDVAVDDPPRPEMGDLASPVALQVARRIGRNPRELATELAARLGEASTPGVRQWEVAGPGFLNIQLDRDAVLRALVSAPSEGRPRVAEKVLVEHTSINPNKAAHVGHLRNACLGDTLVRAYRHLGNDVEVHNYIDDTGVQVADVVIGFLDLRELAAAEVAAIPEPFDYYCWDLYTEVNEKLGEEPAFDARRKEVLLALEKEEGRPAAVARVVVDRIVERHLLTMARLGIRYDLLVKEADILLLDLWSEAFERLQASSAVYFAESGKHTGCWMLSLAGAEGFEGLEEADKVLVRSNGAATYVAKDIAHHLWKYGLLERSFRYAPFETSSGWPVWETTHRDGEEGEFGRADRAISVIDVRQSYLQAIVKLAYGFVGEPRAAETFTHFAYEMVALSPRTAEALGVPVPEDARDRRFIEMSGRRGYGVKADDLLDELAERAAREVRQRNPELPDKEATQIGRQIAVGAARYFLLRFSRTTLIVFDLDEALSFEGETGPYLQYAAVRALHIFDKLREAEIDGVSELLDRLEADGGIDGALALPDFGELLAADDGDLWNLVLALGRLEETVEQAARSHELSVVAKYAFHLAQSFNRFYHGYPILKAGTAADRTLRILVAQAFQRQLETVLGILGIPIPARM